MMGTEAEFFMGELFCDSCGKAAKLVMYLPTEKNHELVLCQHHGNKFVLNMLIKGWKIVHDLREWKAEGSVAEPVPAS